MRFRFAIASKSQLAAIWYSFDSMRFLRRRFVPTNVIVTKSEDLIQTNYFALVIPIALLSFIHWGYSSGPTEWAIISRMEWRTICRNNLAFNPLHFFFLYDNGNDTMFVGWCTIYRNGIGLKIMYFSVFTEISCFHVRFKNWYIVLNNFEY